MRRAGPYSKTSSLIDMDQRSRAARILAGARAELTAHVGGRPTATQRALIERASFLMLHVAQLAAKALAAGMMTERDSRTYLAWSNSLSRALAALGLDGPPQRVPTPLEALGLGLPDRGAAA